MENDLHISEQTEKLVAEVLKTVLSSECQNEVEVDEDVEYVIVDETGSNSQNTSNNDDNIESTQLNMNGDVVEGPSFDMAGQPNYESWNRSDINEIESLISEGLKKIRLEYPMYPVLVNSHNYNDWDHTAVPIVSPLTENSFENTNMPHDSWYVDPINADNHSACSPIYEDEVDNTVYEDDYWEDIPYDDNEISYEWTPSTAILSDVINTKIKETQTESSTENVEETPIIEELLDDSDNDDKSDCLKHVSNVLTNETSAYCLMTNESRSKVLSNNVPDQLMADGISELSVDNSLNTITTGVSTSTSAAIHSEQNSTTTTSATFGVLHQQTSCTTTNFMPNNFANAALATTPAALYAQSILASTAHQYLNVFRKDIQQFSTHNNSSNYNATVSNYNLGIYERLLYAQLLQQQILQQQQQQAAIATVLQQQKIAIQNSTLNVAATVSNTSSSAVNNVGIVISNNDCEFASTTSLNGGASNNVNEITIYNNVVDISTNENLNPQITPVNEECVGTAQKRMLE